MLGTGRYAPAHSQTTVRDRRLGRWSLLGSLVCFAVLILVQASLAELLYPAVALIAGVLLYRHYPVVFVGYVLWVVFLTPEVRRIVDYRSGWSSISPIMLTPWLVAGIAAIGLLRPSGPAWRKRKLKPFLLSLCGIAIGYAVGLLRADPLAATYGMLTWAVPVVFGMHVAAMEHQQYERLREVLQSTFLWGVLIMGTYGVVQFLAAPPWDGYWMIKSGMNSIGTPYPWKVRVFSTLNSPGMFAPVLGVGLLLLLSARSALKWPAFLAGCTGFMLSLVRSAWLGAVIGVLVITFLASSKRRSKIVLGIAGAALAIGLAVYSTPLWEVVGSRVDSLSLSSLSTDKSMNDRLALLQEVQREVLTTPLGYGVGSSQVATKLSSGKVAVFDNGFFNVPYELGWVGGLLFAGGIGVLLFRGFQLVWKQDDLFATIAFAITVSMLAQMLSGNTLINATGLVFWTFAGVLCAREKPSALHYKRSK